MSTDSNNEGSEDGWVNQLVLGLAAHPLSSCNPPPPELPDLLDSLIASEARLEEQVAVIDNVGRGLVRRIDNIKKRVCQLREANSYLKADLNATEDKDSNELLTQRQIYEAKERVLSKMWLQVMFIYTMFSQKVRGMTISTIKAHRDIFAGFLGERHNHPGIQVADSSKLSCAPGCDWYQKHGPYEWSKKPYSNAWLEEMNNTDWDWLRIKDHLTSAITVGGGKAIAVYQMLQANSTHHIPCWFWSEDFDTWTLHGEVERPEKSETGGEHQVIIKVRYNKSQATMKQEKVRKLNEMIKAGLHDPTQATEDPVVEIEKVGEMIIDKTFVFDGMASKATPNGHGQVNVRWLVWWGFEKWHAELMKARSGNQTIDAQYTV